MTPEQEKHFKEWWSRQADVTVRMATPEVIAKAAWVAATERCDKIAEDVVIPVNKDSLQFPSYATRKAIVKAIRGG